MILLLNHVYISAFCADIWTGGLTLRSVVSLRGRQRNIAPGLVTGSSAGLAGRAGDVQL